MIQMLNFTIVKKNFYHSLKKIVMIVFKTKGMALVNIQKNRMGRK